MIDGLKPFPAYKNSDSPWLGEVPAHWTEKRAKYFYREVDERSTTGEEELMSVSHKTGVTPRKAHVTMFMAESNVGHKICRADDLVINTMWAFMAALGVARQVGVVSPSYGVYRPRRSKELHSQYVDHLLRVENYKSEYLCRSTGINSSRLRLYPDQFLRIPILCPPPEEQAAIVRFLDHTDRRIRAYIKAKHRLIALLNEQKQAIIHRAVTRGIDPRVRLKPSGVEWLGDVPEHWAVLALKRLLRIQGGHAYPSTSFGERGVPVVRMNNLKRGRLDLSDVVRISESDCSDRFSLKAGDLLYGLSGSVGATGSLGNFAIVHEDHLPLQLNQRVGRFLTTSSKIETHFLCSLIQTPTFYEQVLAKTTGTAQFNVSTADIEGVQVALPPIDEQFEIIRTLGETTGQLDLALLSTHREIDVTREYRIRLIADVVTGKLDVRDAAAQLPYETEEQEPPDDAGVVAEWEDTTDDNELEAVTVEAEV